MSTTNASTIKARRIRWAWRGRLALGYVSLWSGESSLGKSTCACSVIAEMTHGRLDGHLHGKPSKALIVASEDAREDVWIPRLTVAGADLDLVEFYDQGDEWNLRDGMADVGGDLDKTGARFVFIDSVLEHLPEPKGGESANSAPFIRRALRPFGDVCKARGVAGLVSTHPPKSRGATFADYVMASAAFVHVARVGLLFAWHPDDLELPDQERRRVLLRPPGGSNIGRDPGAFEFSLATKNMQIEGEDEEVPYTTALEPSDVTFRDLTRTPKPDAPPRPKIADARALIAERLADGEWHPSMIDELIEQGFAKSTAYRAAEGVVKVKGRAEDAAWWWAAAGTPESSFVEVEAESGNFAARARSNSQGGNNPPKPPPNGSVERSSHIPVDLDEGESSEPLFPHSQTPPARTRTRKASSSAYDRSGDAP
jgi:hypothetical protein